MTLMMSLSSPFYVPGRHHISPPGAVRAVLTHDTRHETILIFTTVMQVFLDMPKLLPSDCFCYVIQNRCSFDFWKEYFTCILSPMRSPCTTVSQCIKYASIIITSVNGSRR